MEYILIAILTIRSLLHSSCRSNTFILDAAFEPVYWFVDCVAGVMGLVSLKELRTVTDLD